MSTGRFSVALRSFDFTGELGRPFKIELYVRAIAVCDVMRAPLWSRSTPFSAAHLEAMRLIQFRNMLLMVHPELRPRILEHRGDRDWRFRILRPTNDPKEKTE